MTLEYTFRSFVLATLPPLAVLPGSSVPWGTRGSERHVFEFLLHFLLVTPGLLLFAFGTAVSSRPCESSESWLRTEKRFVLTLAIKVDLWEVEMGTHERKEGESESVFKEIPEAVIYFSTSDLKFLQ